jgi:RNA polymerase sigma-70 factor, ECF subfamily
VVEEEVDAMNLPDNPNPERLLAAARAGNHDAREQLLELYRFYLTMLADLKIDRRLQGKIVPADLVRETLQEANRSFAQFPGGTKRELLIWLRRILLFNLENRMRCWLVTHACEGTLDNTLDELDESSRLLDWRRITGQGSPSSQATRRQPTVVLADALAQLPDDCREVIILRHLEGLTLLQVASRMGRPIENIKQLWFCALARLSRIWSET